MGDATQVIDTYLEAYGEADVERRQALIEQAWSPDGVLADPPMDAAGHAAIDEMFAAVQGSFAGHVFRRTSAVDEHHATARYGWELVGPDGAVALAGMDVASFDQDGKLLRVTGWFGDMPALDA